ncbi:MarR family winged helix-turn-helix transcriptional regulator [Agrococcus carbonis]|uniref:DNA-binding transcriptional regulator, MarR family n=1 Tax=Agrococcus carbonis TaxID=684552 RepID=A0A1H1P031_9MICO|nr:MarR family transcriptional regulator [Agrococcus carbonis]SDS04553.1 DNA-binding transcriptional regulator, MarR family [Agrococcus carbonis]
MEPDAVAAIIEQWRAERPELDPSPIGVVGRLSRVSRHVTADLVALYRGFGLSEGEFDILATLRRTGAPFALSPSALREATMVTQGAVSKRLDSLEAKGLVAREASADDGRGRVVRLTDAGRGLIDEAFVAHLENERRILAPLPEADRAALERILAAWARHYEG